MAEKQLTLPGQIVKKHNHLVRSKINLNSVLGSKILANLIACIHKDDKEFKDVYRISIKSFLPALGGGNYSQVKEVCRELVKATVEIEFFTPDGRRVFHPSPFFSSLKYTDGEGFIEARFNSLEPYISKCLLDLSQHFTKINLIEYLKLPSIYSQRIYEILKSWDDKPEVHISLENLHHMLNTPKSFKSNFAQFRRFVLKKAYDDINTKTSDMEFEWEPVKKGKAVVAIHFIFDRKRISDIRKEKEAKDRNKNSAQTNKRILEAVDCFKIKNKNCSIRDNKPVICAACEEFGQVPKATSLLTKQHS